MKKNSLIALASAAMVSWTTLTPAFASTGYTVTAGDTMWKIAQANHISVQLLELANPTVNPQNIAIGSALSIPALTPYTIQSGDTMWKLSQRYHVSLANLRAANPAINPQNLLIGTEISLPDTSSTSSTSATGSTAATGTTNGSAAGTTTNDPNLYWLERAVHAEADGEPMNAQIAVADVILNRLHNGSYGNTVQSVVFQVISGHYQFSCVPDGTIYNTPDAMNIQAATAAMSGNNLVPSAFVFYNPAKTPSGSWVWNQPTVTHIGDFVFAE